MTDVLTTGEAMASLRPDHTGPLRLGGVLRLTVAGAEANVAIGLARLGHAVRWVGRVGEDELGALVLRTLRAEGVDVGLARVDSEGSTGVMLVERRTGDLIRVDYRRAGSAGSRLHGDDLAPALADGARILHVTGITPALGPTARAAVAAAVEQAHAAGVTVCLDVNHRSRLWSADEARPVLRALLPHVHVLVASEEELGLVVPSGGADDEDEQVRGLLKDGLNEVVVKRGARGATAVTEEGTAHRPAYSVTVADTMGAGDAFVAGYLSGMLDELAPAERLDRASATAAFVVTCHGDWEGLPTRAELALLNHRPGDIVR